MQPRKRHGTCRRVANLGYDIAGSDFSLLATTGGTTVPQGRVAWSEEDVEQNPSRRRLGGAFAGNRCPPCNQSEACRPCPLVRTAICRVVRHLHWRAIAERHLDGRLPPEGFAHQAGLGSRDAGALCRRSRPLGADAVRKPLTQFRVAVPVTRLGRWPTQATGRRLEPAEQPPPP